MRQNFKSFQTTTVNKTSFFQIQNQFTILLCGGVISVETFLCYMFVILFGDQSHCSLCALDL